MTNRINPKPMYLNGGKLAVTQPHINGWIVSWNPDDELFYIERRDGTTYARIKDWRNVCTKCNTNTAQ